MSETVDGRLYIGFDGAGQLIGIGFSGNGMTYDTLGGLMMADAIGGEEIRRPDLRKP